MKVKYPTALRLLRLRLGSDWRWPMQLRPLRFRLLFLVCACRTGLRLLHQV
jgi:hypothetical protein